jgi:hypothetical protein
VLDSEITAKEVAVLHLPYLSAAAESAIKNRPINENGNLADEITFCGKCIGGVGPKIAYRLPLSPTRFSKPLKIL